MTCHLQSDADPAPDFYLMRIRMRIHNTDFKYLRLQVLTFLISLFAGADPDGGDPAPAVCLAPPALPGVLLPQREAEVRQGSQHQVLEARRLRLPRVCRRQGRRTDILHMLRNRN